MPDNIIFENDMYIVTLVNNNTEYAVINKQTDVVEGVTKSMPDALTTAVMSQQMVNAVLEQEKGEAAVEPNILFNH